MWLWLKLEVTDSLDSGKCTKVAIIALYVSLQSTANNPSYTPA